MTPELLLENLLAHWLQAGAVAGVALLGVTAVRLRDARVQLLGWQALLLLLLLLPWLQPWQPVAPLALEVDRGSVWLEVVSVLGGAGPSSEVGRLTERPGTDPWSWLLTLLGAGVVVRVGWLATGVARLRRLTGRSGGTGTPEVAAELQRRIGVTARFVRSPETRTPYSFGVLAPTVVLPMAFDAMEPSFQRAILCHELVHIRRRDLVCAVVEEAVVACLWFHPWVWVIRRRIRLAREQVVDAAVVRLTGDRPAYVRCLVAVAGGRFFPSLAASMSRPGEVRVRTDTLFQEVDMSKFRLMVVTTVLCLLLGTTTWFSVSTVPLRAMSAHSVVAEASLGLGVATAQSADEAAINEVVEENLAALARGDAAAYAATYTENAVRSFRAMVGVGRANIEKGMSEFFAELGGGIRMTFSRHETRLLSPTTAIVHGAFAYAWTSATPDGHETFTLVKEGNEWLIAADQISQ